jgi:hypothetical protein
VFALKSEGLGTTYVAAHLRRGKWIVKRLMVLAACFAVALVISGCSAGSGGVPDLTGLAGDQAGSLADKAGLKLVTKQEVPCFLPVGTVMTQDPLPGLKSSDGTIQVTVSREPIPVQITKLNASDPDGNERENSGDIGKLTDGDLNTSWSTEKYVSPTFAGLGEKHGVGLSFSLAEEATMLKISYTIGGWKGEVQRLRSNRSPIAIAQLGDTQQVNLMEPLSSGRIWFFQLAPLPDSPRYGVIINEIGFYK